MKEFILLRGQALWSSPPEIVVGEIYWVDKKVRCRVYKVMGKRAYIGDPEDDSQTIDVALHTLYTQKLVVKQPYTHNLIYEKKGTYIIKPCSNLVSRIPPTRRI